MNKLLFLLLLFSLNNETADKSECDKFREGTFKLDDGENVYTIIRTQNRQLENAQGRGTMEFKIRWMSDCSYILYDRKVVDGEGMPDAGFDTLYCKITSIDGLSYRAKCKMRGYGEIETPPIVKIK